MNEQPPILPRLLTKGQAVAYAAGGSVRRFDRWRKVGMMPPRVPGTTMFDRLAIDAAVDKMAGIVSAQAKSAGSPAEDSFEEWKRKRDEQRKNRGR